MPLTLKGVKYDEALIELSQSYDLENLNIIAACTGPRSSPGKVAYARIAQLTAGEHDGQVAPTEEGEAR